MRVLYIYKLFGARYRIWTCGTVTRSLDFESSAFDHSANLAYIYYNISLQILQPIPLEVNTLAIK